MNGYVHLIVIKLHEQNPILIILDHLIHVLTFKWIGQRKIPDISWKLDFFSFVSMVTVQDSRTLPSPIGKSLQGHI